MPLRYKARLIQHMRHEEYKPSNVAALAESLRIADIDEFTEAIDELKSRGIVAVDDKGRVSLPSVVKFGREIVGKIKVTSRGFAFVTPRETVKEGDIFIPPGSTLDAMTGDEVLIEVRRDRRRERQGSFQDEQFVGEVVEILKRKRAAFTGTVFKQGSMWLVAPDGKNMNDPIVVRDAESKNVRENDKVVVDILEYPEGGSLAEGVISKVLGEAGQPDVETQAVIAAYDLPGEFTDECLDQAREITQQFDDELDRWKETGELEHRADVTDEYIITIDPPDAKDYDDAISVTRLADGWELGVHIADVGHFIDPGTALDLEAIERGNSVYLPRLVIPMLPELLSNGICSLQEAVPRYAKSLYIRYSKNGDVKGTRAQSSLIQSVKRLTYIEAQALIEGDVEEAKANARTEPNYTDKLIETVRDFDTLARTIQARRRRHGMITLDLPDVELVYSDEGHVVDAVKEDQSYTHTVIEMFMVEANEGVARLFERMQVPLIRRIHPEPTPGDSDTLKRMAMVAGYRIPANPTREEMQGLLDATRGTPAARAVHMALLRTLTKAEYSPALIGHFALASEAYAHFTSPIRRYPDLTVHRALKAFLQRTANGENPPKSEKAWLNLGKDLREDPLCLPEDALVELGRSCTTTEQNAEDAERDLRQFLVLQLLEKKIGEVFDGVVTGVTPRGVYVQIEPYLADGMITKEDLPGDVTRDAKPPKWRVDDKTGALVDANSGRSYNMGDSVKVRVAAVDLARRELDLVIDDPESRAGGKAKKLKFDSGFDGGLGGGKGAGFKQPGGSRRNRKSKSRDRGKENRRDKRK